MSAAVTNSQRPHEIETDDADDHLESHLQPAIAAIDLTGNAETPAAPRVTPPLACTQDAQQKTGATEGATTCTEPDSDIVMVFGVLAEKAVEVIRQYLPVAAEAKSEEKMAKEMMMIEALEDVENAYAAAQHARLEIAAHVANREAVLSHWILFLHTARERLAQRIIVIAILFMMFC